MKPGIPTVTAIIPTYNRARFVSEAIDSVLAQSRPVDEIIVVDDGSTDDTPERLKKYGNSIRYIWQPNRGPAAARNRGIKEARGDFIAFQDSDDLWVPNKTERQLAFMHAHPDMEISFGLMANFAAPTDEATPEIKNWAIYRQLQANASHVTDLFRILLQWNVVPTPTVLLRRSCFERIGYFREDMCQAEDYELWLRAAQLCRWGFVDSVLLHRRRHASNLINDWVTRKKLMVGFLQTMLDSGRNSEHAPLVRKNLSAAHYDLGSYFAKRGAFHEAAAHLSLVAPEHRPAFWYPKAAVSVLLSRAIDIVRKSRSRGIQL
jgi:glycosyltransferase involved in cell wall biosynthesis